MTTALLSEVGRGEVALGITIPVVSLSPEEVGARIARAREKKRWSQMDLAIVLGVSPSTVYRWEKGKLPSVNELIRLAEVLDIPLSSLVETPEQLAEVSDLRRLCEEIQQALEVIRDGAERAQEAIVESLASTDVRLSRIEALLETRGDQGQAQP